jgi:hypothetical protein
MNTRALVLVCLIAATGCERSGSHGSGALAKDEAALLKELPGGNVALIGGNYMKLQNFMQSSFGKMVRDVGTKVSGTDGMSTWMDCFAKFPNLKLIGGVAMTATGLEVRLLFAGISVTDVAGCAKQAGFTTAIDADGKFVSLDIPTAAMKVNQGYLALPDGSLYMRQSFGLGLAPRLEPTTRPDLEADLAKVGKASAADDKALVELAGKVDHTQPFWFAGSGANTQLADKLGAIYGTIDIGDGITVNVTAQIKDHAKAEQIQATFDQMKKSRDQLPEDLRAVIDQLKLERSADDLHLYAKITAAQLELLKAMGGIGGH